MAHIAGEQLVSFLGLPTSRDVNEDSEHDAADHANIVALSPSRNPPNFVTDHYAKVDLIRTHDRASRRERCPHSVTVGGVDMSRKVFERNKLADRPAPQAIPAFIHRELVAIDVPRPQSYTRGINGEV